MEKNKQTNLDSSSLQLIKRLFREYLHKYTPNIGLAVVCMIVAAGATAAMAWMMQPVLDKIFVEQQTGLLIPISLAVFALAIAKGISTYFHTVIMKILANRLATDMQIDLFNHLLRSDISLFASQASGNLISRFTNDISMIRGSITNLLTGLVREPMTLVFLVGVMFTQNFQLALIAFFIFPLAIYPIVWLGKRMRKVSTRTQEMLGLLTSKLDDMFQGIRIVKAYGQENKESKHAQEIVEKTFKLYSKAARISSAASPLMEMLAGVAIAAVIAYGGSQVLSGETTPGSFFSFMTALIMAYRPMKTISALNTNLQQSVAAIIRHYDVMDKVAEISDFPGAKTLKNPNGTIKFKNVSFNYGPEKTTLRNLSLEIPSGSRVALVGHSGAGKSTIMNLVLRFYDPDKGSITIDGQDIKKCTLESLRKSFAIVTQETTLFDDSVKANIGYGIERASDENIISAAKAAAAHDFIEEMPDGYDTMIGQRGVRLSGGQRQRLAIARAMLRNAPILLLDEATSSLDNVSEQLVQEALDKLMAGRTTLVIAHRLSTVKNADIIYVLKDGRIIESGDHETLLKKKGEYCELYSQQFRDDVKSAA